MSDAPSGKLKEQDLSNLDVTKLTPSSPEVISRQATINIGTIGHVAHGKSTIVKAVSGVQTVRFKNELERNITIKLDSANDDSQQSTSSDTNNKKHYKFDLSTSKIKIVRCYDERNLDNINAALLTAEKCLEKSSDEESKDVKKNNNKRLLLHGTKSTPKKYANSNIRQGKRRISRNRNNSVQKKVPLCYISNSRFEADGANETDSLNVIEHDDEKSNDSFSNLKLSDVTHKLINNDNISMLDDSDASSSFTDTATIMIPQVFNKRVDVSFNYMISNDRIRDFILSGQMMVHDDNGEDVYNPTEIDDILDDEIINGVHYYLVKWKNWSKGFETWEYFGSLIKAQKLILKYELKKNDKDFDNPKSIDGIHLMLSRNIISKIFEISIAESGLSLPAITSEELSSLSIDLEIGKTVTQAYRKKCLSSQLAIVSLGYYRQVQLSKLLQWEIDINLMESKIKVENDVDLEEPPDSFAYTHKYIPRCGIIISDDPPIGCDCKRNCVSSDDCCNEMSGFSSVYDSNKNITIAPGYPVFECNKKCKCSAACTNRVVQLGSSVNICIYKTKKRGWGIKTLSNIQKGQYVGNYIGEIITVEESERRLENNSSRLDHMWNLDFDDVEDFKYTIDGSHFANFTCFINHSCDANLNVYAVWVDCLDRNLPQLALFANKEISVGEELTTDYFSRCSQDVLKKSGVRCQCNMKNCKGYYF